MGQSKILFNVLWFNRYSLYIYILCVSVPSSAVFGTEIVASGSFAPRVPIYAFVPSVATGHIIKSPGDVGLAPVPGNSDTDAFVCPVLLRE